jgi:betaine-aldehyde dehydrogenase
MNQVAMNQFPLPGQRGLFYGGGWHQAAGGTAATVSPSTGRALGDFAVADASDVDRAVTAARAGAGAWQAHVQYQRSAERVGSSSRGPAPGRGR